DARVERDLGWSALGYESDTLDFLSRYRRLGLAVVMLHGIAANGGCTCREGLNCEPKQRGKHPLWSGYLEGEPRWDDMQAELRRTWRRNIALRLGDQPNGSRLIAMDIDGGDELLEPIEREFGPLPPTLTERSGRGSHRIYRLPDGVAYPLNKTIAPGVEIKSTRGKITAPPSMHVDGHRRRWTNPVMPAVLP
ncbi:MAG TPA: bifunctional DNA primase/polymerase, partial [Polyangiaceae bacterium]